MQQLTKSPALWWFNFQYIISFVVHWHHVVTIVRGTICLIFQAALFCVKFHLQQQ